MELREGGFERVEALVAVEVGVATAVMARGGSSEAASEKDLSDTWSEALNDNGREELLTRRRAKSKGLLERVSKYCRSDEESDSA